MIFLSSPPNLPFLSTVKSHTGIPGNEKADLNASLGVSTRTPIGRFSTFPPGPLFPLPHPSTPTLTPDLHTIHFVDTISTQTYLCFPTSSQSIRKPYLSSDAFSLVQELQHSSPEVIKPLRNKTKRSAKRDKKQWLISRLESDHFSPSAASQWRTLKRVRSKYSPRIQSVNFPNGSPAPESLKATLLAQHLRDNVWSYQ